MTVGARRPQGASVTCDGSVKERFVATFTCDGGVLQPGYAFVTCDSAAKEQFVAIFTCDGEICWPAFCGALTRVMRQHVRPILLLCLSAFACGEPAPEPNCEPSPASTEGTAYECAILISCDEASPLAKIGCAGGVCDCLERGGLSGVMNDYSLMRTFQSEDFCDLSDEAQAELAASQCADSDDDS